MIFTQIYIDNFFNFYDTTIDLTFKREIKDSVIEGEYLEERPKFRFKRVCILSGANASGKTSLGLVLRHIQHFILYPNSYLENVYDKSKTAILNVEFVFPATNTIHSLYIKQHSKNDDYPEITYASIPILKSDTAYSTRKRLQEYIEKEGDSKISGIYYSNSQNTKTSYSFEDIRNMISSGLCFYYLYSENTEKKGFLIENLDSKILKSVLRTFDPSIESVNEFILDDELEGYSIHFRNKDKVLIDKEGYVTNKSRLSKGTYDSIEVASFIAFVLEVTKQHQKDSSDICATYFLDEKMAYSHSELEQAIINLIIQKMGRYSQFFYTTHNYDILDMNLPIHSYLFLKKDEDRAKFVQPEHQFSKNDRSLLNYVKNDIFDTVPDISLVDELLFEG